MMRCSIVSGLMIIFGALGGASAQEPPIAPPVTVAPPVSKRITQWDEYSGRFEAVERVVVRPRVSGYIDKIHFKDGSMVKAGDLLVTIDKRPFILAVESGKAEVARQVSIVDFAEADVKRGEPLVESKVMSEQVFEQRRATLGQAQASLQAAQAALKTAELNLEWADVKAPISGRISDKKVDAGNLVAGGQDSATQLATIVSLDPIHFVFEASEADYLRYARQQATGERESSRTKANPVRVKLADEKDWSHDGKMDFVDNALNERSGTIRGRAIFANTDGFLAPGVFARLALFGGDIDALLVPDASIVADQARKIVFTVNPEGIVTPVAVTLGPIYEGLRVIKSGLKAGDKVVIEGIANPAVRPGAKVTPTDGQIKAATN